MTSYFFLKNLSILLVTKYPPKTFIDAKVTARNTSIIWIVPSIGIASAPTRAIPDIALEPDIRGVWRVLGTLEIISTPRYKDRISTNPNKI